MPSVLIVDDLLSIHEMLDAVIQPTGFSTAFATDGEKGLQRFKTERQDIVLADIDMKPMDGISLLKQIKQVDPNAIVVIMTGYASTDSAMQALKFGAFDYLQKPFRVDELIATLRRGMEHKKTTTVDSAAPAPVAKAETLDVETHLAGTNPRFVRVVQQVKKLCTVRTPALLQGEAGTGKGTIAGILHANGPHPDGKLVRVDCSLNNEGALRHGLIGNNGEGGAWIQEARGGSLFMRHLHCLPLAMQKDFVGVLRNTAHTFRLVATTTEDLEKLTDEGKFHDELFYRVAALPVMLPPLRERTEDIPALVRYFTGKTTNPFFDSSAIEFTDDAMEVLRAYHWPGNITELQQVVSKIAAAADNRVIGSAQLPLRLKEPKQWPSLADFIASQQKHYIESVMRACNGDRNKAAKALGIPLTQLP